MSLTDIRLKLQKALEIFYGDSKKQEKVFAMSRIKRYQREIKEYGKGTIVRVRVPDGLYYFVNVTEIEAIDLVTHIYKEEVIVHTDSLVTGQLIKIKKEL